MTNLADLRDDDVYVITLVKGSPPDEERFILIFELDEHVANVLESIDLWVSNPEVDFNSLDAMVMALQVQSVRED